MTSSIPVEWLRVSALPSVTGPAFFRAGAMSDGVFLVTGGSDPQAIFLTGDHAGRCFQAKAGASRLGFAIHDIEIVVDQDSVFRTDKEGFPERALAVGASGTSVMATLLTAYGFDDTYCWDIQTGKAVEYPSNVLGFRHWRLVKRSGAEAIVLHEVLVTKPD